MKRNFSTGLLTVLSAMFVLAITSCKDKNESKKAEEEVVTKDKFVAAGEEIPMREVTVMKDGCPIVYNIADIEDNAAEYRTDVVKENCFIVISKKEFRLYVYEVVAGDTALVAHYPICYAKYKEPKEREGDMKTPETKPGVPFTISEIRDYSARAHDFGDGRGSILSYGHWFMALTLNGYTGTGGGIGIHGSTNNPESVPGRGSEGCIRLRDNDINALHDKYAVAPMDVYIKSCTADKLHYEVKAEKALGSKYKAPKLGNPLKDSSNASAEDAQDGDGKEEAGQEMGVNDF